VRELAAVDDARGAVIDAELPLRLVGDDRDRPAADGARDLERHAPEPAGRSPDQNHIPALDDVGRPAHEHPVRRGSAEEEAARRLPGQALRLRNTLMGLAAGKLAVAAIVGLIAPDARRFGEHRVPARAHPRVVGSPPAAVDDDLVADPRVLDVAADGPDDAGAVAAAGVEVLGLARLLALADHVERRAQRRPDVVVVDPRRHHVDQHFVGAEGRRRDDLAPPRLARRAETVLPHDVRVHARRHVADGRSLAEIVQVSHVAPPVRRSPRR